MINILFGGNYKVFDGILLCILSAVKHTDEELNIYILTANLTELNKEYKPINELHIKVLNEVVKSKNPNSKVNLIHLNEEFNEWIMKSENKLNSYTPFAFLRLFADQITNLPNKIIYLDTDIMINSNIKELFDIDISKHELGVVKDRYGHVFIRPNYFNSGMLLLNMTNIKNSNLFEKVRNMCFYKKMSFPDQSALNKLCKNKLYLLRKFNEQGKIRKNTIVHHFSKKIKWLPFFHTQNVKPWEMDAVHKKYKCFNYDDIYLQFNDIKQKMHLTKSLSCDTMNIGEINETKY